MTNCEAIKQEKLGLYLYKNAFSYFKMGYASAQAWIMLLVAMVIIIIMFKLFRFGETEMS